VSCGRPIIHVRIVCPTFNAGVKLTKLIQIFRSWCQRQSRVKHIPERIALAVLKHDGETPSEQLPVNFKGELKFKFSFLRLGSRRKQYVMWDFS
jgi:hypothetical protein